MSDRILGKPVQMHRRPARRFHQGSVACDKDDHDDDEELNWCICLKEFSPIKIIVLALGATIYESREEKKNKTRRHLTILLLLPAKHQRLKLICPTLNNQPQSHTKDSTRSRSISSEFSLIGQLFCWLHVSTLTGVPSFHMIKASI